MLDEQAKRKSNFDQRNSVPVILADGQTWFVPKPWLEIRPVFQNSKAVTAYPVLTYGEELDGLVEAIAACDSMLEQVSAVASLGAFLLQWHYELSEPDLDQLFVFRPSHEQSLTWMREVCAIATGQSGPKAFRAGGD